MGNETYSMIQMKESTRKRLLALCPEGTDEREFLAAFTEKAIASALSLFDMLPDTAAGCVTGGRIRLPVFPTREEIAEYCNDGWPDRPHPITYKSVRGWEGKGWIKRHPVNKRDIRYVNTAVVDFLNGKFKSRF